MSFKELFEVFPQLLNLFVPGFIFLSIYRYFSEVQDKDFNLTTIGSIVLSYIFRLLATLICREFNASDIICTAITILMSIIFALVIVKLSMTPFYKRIISWIGKTTGSDNIWYDLFDLAKGTRVRFFAKYNNENVIVVGDVKYFEAYDDGECNIVIINYQIEYVDSGNVYKNGNPSATMIFNSKYIHGLEAHYGQ